MQKAYSKRNWKNRPNTSTPLGESNLTPMDNAIDEIDNRVVAYDTTKANQSDLLTAFKAVSFNSSTGVFTFTKFNDTTVTVDTDIEKIAINFDYDDDPTSAHYQNLVITLDDGTVKYVDMAALITVYEFTDTTTIHFTVSSSGVISANVINGSITSDHLAPSVTANINAAVSAAEGHAEDSEAWAVGKRNGTDVPITDDTYHNNSKYYSGLSKDSAEDSEAYAIGKRGGTDVPSTDPTYHNNAKYYAEQAEASLSNTVRSFNGRTGAVTPSVGDYNLDDMGDVNITSPTDGQGLRYDSQSGKWVNGDAASAVSNLTDVNLTNLADGEILKYNSTSQKWENKEDSAGHTIQNESGTALTQRSKMQFKGNLKASDDSTNQRTVVDTKNTHAYGYVESMSSGVYIATASGYELGDGVLELIFSIAVQAQVANGIFINVNNQGSNLFRTLKQVSVNETVFNPGDVAIFIYNRADGFFTQIKTGHSLLNQSGTALASRGKIQFPDAHLEDDSANTRTKIELVKEVTQSQLENLGSNTDGRYFVDDGEDAEIGPASDDYVEVEQVTGGTKTYGQLLDDLFSLIDPTKINQNTTINHQYSVTGFDTFHRSQTTNNKFTFTCTYVDNNTSFITVALRSSGSTLKTSDNVTITDYSSTVASIGTKITLYYGNKSAVIDLQTTANRCLMGNGETVQSTIDGLINGGLKMFAGTGSITVAPQTDNTSSITIADIKQASGFTTIYHILCNFEGNGSGTPALLWYSGSDSKFHSYGVYSGGTYNNVGFSYVAFGV